MQCYEINGELPVKISLAVCEQINLTCVYGLQSGVIISHRVIALPTDYIQQIVSLCNFLQHDLQDIKDKNVFPRLGCMNNNIIGSESKYCTPLPEMWTFLTRHPDAK